TRPLDIVLMVQREVADRILAEPGGREYGALSVGVRTVARVERLFDVGRRAFRPVPDVDSSVVRITPVRPPPLSEPEERAVRTLTRAAFSRRRKQLGTILRSAPELALDADAVDALAEETGIEMRRRPETLAPDEFVALTRGLRARGRLRGG
ncbi:MAG: ribosomal RNA small subunit methyltransferase A, partial [Longimicrobiales bacterium]